MTQPCNAKIVATLGPASADRKTIEALVRAGADVFRLNFSHGTQADHRRRLEIIRAVEADVGRPIGVLLDLLVAVFVMGIIVFQIQRDFDHIDVDRLTALHDAGEAPPGGGS